MSASMSPGIRVLPARSTRRAACAPRRRLPPRPRQALSARGQAAGVAGTPDSRGKDVPRDGYELLAGAMKGREQQIGVRPWSTPNPSRWVEPNHDVRFQTSRRCRSRRRTVSHWHEAADAMAALHAGRTTNCQKTVSFRLLPGPGFHTIEPKFVGMLVIAGGKELMGVRNACISEMERGRDGAWTHDCNVSCGTERGFG